MAVQIQPRRGTAAAWTSTNPTLAEGEIGLETDTSKFKFGTGAAAWNSLSYAVGPGVTEIVDLPTAEMNAALVLAPDGAGGVHFRAETGGGGGGMTNPMAAPGDMIVQPALGTDLALFATINCSHSVRDYEMPNLVDGNDSSKGDLDQSGVNGTWVRVDLGSPQAVASYRVLTAADSHRQTAYKIQSSDDDATWTDQAVAGSPDVDSGIVALASPATAQYWRILGTIAATYGPQYYTFSLYAPSNPVAIHLGARGKVLAAGTSEPDWTSLVTVQAGTPVGGGYLTPLVFDNTATTGGLYCWTGSDYAVAVKTT